MLFYRQKVLLGLLDVFGGELPSTDFQKYLFLYTRLCEKEKSYEFVPYKFGCFSFQSYADKNKLVEQGYLEDVSDWKLVPSKQKQVRQLARDDNKKLLYFKSKYEKLTGKQLVRHVYINYPYYAINSKIAEGLLSEAEYSNVVKLKVIRRKPLFATIGYEGLSIEQYVNRLIENDVRMLVDVRKNPLSRKYGFSKKSLSDILSKVGIKYQHIPDLGIVSDKRKELNTPQDYQKLFIEYEKTVIKTERDSLKDLYQLYEENKRIAITCFEECHTMCHRHKVSEAIEKFAAHDFTVTHL